MSLIRLTASDGKPVVFEDQIRASGGMKDVYFAPNEAYVVAFYRTPADAASRERLAAITGTYRERIFNQAGGDYWRTTYCWPVATVEYQGRLGVVVVPFTSGIFSSPTARATMTCWASKAAKREQVVYLRQQPQPLPRPARAGHLAGPTARVPKPCACGAPPARAGLAHSDLSYKMS